MTGCRRLSASDTVVAVVTIVQNSLVERRVDWVERWRRVSELSKVVCRLGPGLPRDRTQVAESAGR